MKIRLANNIQSDSIVDGPGIRTVIWTQGCPHNCPGCHNPETHNFNGGFEMDVNELKEQLSSLRNQDGITLSGGEPMMQPVACLEIAKHAHSLGLNVWCYSGFTYEQLISKGSTYLELLNNIDTLVDGKFILEQRSYNTKFRGSSNQRIKDVKRSLEDGQVVLIDKYNNIELNNDLYTKPEFMFV
jgi:anaerobic ribonucleoside-triphosphate reductase activating protein